MKCNQMNITNLVTLSWAWFTITACPSNFIIIILTCVDWFKRLVTKQSEKKHEDNLFIKKN